MFVFYLIQPYDAQRLILSSSSSCCYLYDFTCLSCGLPVWSACFGFDGGDLPAGLTPSFLATSYPRRSYSFDGSAEPRKRFTEERYRSLVSSMTAYMGRSKPYSRLAIITSVACLITSYVIGSPADFRASGRTLS